MNLLPTQLFGYLESVLITVAPGAKSTKSLRNSLLAAIEEEVEPEHMKHLGRTIVNSYSELELKALMVEYSGKTINLDNEKKNESSY